MLKKLSNLISPGSAPSHVGASESALLRKHLAVEQRATVLAGQSIAYTLKRSSKRRSIGLRIDDRGLTVSIPLRATEHWLNEVLQDRASWVVEKLAGWQSLKVEPLAWRDGEIIPYLGDVLILRIIPTMNFAITVQRQQELHVSFRGEMTALRVERAVTVWYQQQAMALFTSRIAYFSMKLGVLPLSVRLSSAKTQWGSCSSKGNVSLNLQLIKLPMDLIDYVVVHELAHLREMNHTVKFWNVVAGLSPDYERLRRKLKSYRL